jgi:hypothetical protein
MAGCFGHAGELVAILKANADAAFAAQVDDTLKFLCCAVFLALAADANMIEAAIASA